MEPEIHDLMMQEDSVPFCFEAFQFIKQNLRNISKEKDEQSVGCHTISMDTSQQSSQVFDDPFARLLDDVCCKSSSPLANHVLERKVDHNLIQKSPSLSCLIDFSLQSPFQGCSHMRRLIKETFVLFGISNRVWLLTKFRILLIACCCHQRKIAKM